MEANQISEWIRPSLEQSLVATASPWILSVESRMCLLEIGMGFIIHVSATDLGW
jgi:hypothetical protein